MTSPRRPLYLALVHHPVRDAQGETVTTAVTNLDVHDIARSCRTYGVLGYFLITPIEAQLALVDRILSHWREGSGGTRIPARAEALRTVDPVTSIEAACAQVRDVHGEEPIRVATAAAPPASLALTGFAGARAQLAEAGPPWVLLFGTGHGLTEPVLRQAHQLLAPIRPGRYNHLSVRAAVAIALDRLVGD